MLENLKKLYTRGFQLWFWFPKGQSTVFTQVQDELVYRIICSQCGKFSVNLLY
jgi:hypothetical protein